MNSSQEQTVKPSSITNHKIHRDRTEALPSERSNIPRMRLNDLSASSGSEQFITDRGKKLNSLRSRGK